MISLWHAETLVHCTKMMVTILQRALYQALHLYRTHLVVARRYNSRIKFITNESCFIISAPCLSPRISLSTTKTSGDLAMQTGCGAPVSIADSLSPKQQPMEAWGTKAWSFGRELTWIAPDDLEEADGEEIATEAEGFTWIYQLQIREVSTKERRINRYYIGHRQYYQRHWIDVTCCKAKMPQKPSTAPPKVPRLESIEKKWHKSWVISST